MHGLNSNQFQRSMAIVTIFLPVLLTFACVFGFDNEKENLSKTEDKLGISTQSAKLILDTPSYSNKDNPVSERQRRYDRDHECWISLSISDSKAYVGDINTLHAELSCHVPSLYYSLVGRAPEITFFQGDVKKASIFIGFVDLNCHYRYPNGSYVDCISAVCKCSRSPYNGNFNFYLHFNVSADQQNTTFYASSMTTLTSNKVHMYVPNFNKSEATLSISKTTAYVGELISLHVVVYCKTNDFVCNARPPEMNFYQNGNIIATLRILSSTCFNKYPNGFQVECTPEMCSCFKPESNIYVFHLNFNTSAEQLGSIFYAESRISLRSKNVHLYVTIGGAVFTHWGSDHCGSSINKKLFSGYSNYLFHENSPLGYLCLPGRNTALGMPIIGRKRKRSVRSQNAIVSSSTDPCAVCRSRRATSVVMVPGRSSCYEDMVLEYHGYLIPGSHDVICLDIARATNITKTRFVNVIKTGCDGDRHCVSSLNVGPIECAVCSK